MKKWSYHKSMSYAKSFIRILGYVFLWVNLYIAILLLVGAEVLGILEENEE